MTGPGETGRPVIEPVVRWPRSAVAGQDYLVEVDLRIPDSADPPSGDLTFSFLLDGAPYVRVRSAGEPVVTITEPDRTTGPARFVITPRGPAGRRVLRLTLCSARGLPLRVDQLAMTVSAPARRPEADRPESVTWSRAEEFSAKAATAMRRAEDAAEAFRPGTAAAQETLSEMGRQAAMASMYSRAASVQFARARYLGGAAGSEPIAAVPGERTTEA